MADAELDPEQVGQRIDALLGELRVAAGGRAADRAEELAGLLVEMYGEGLRRIVDALDGLDPEVVRRLARDPLIGSLLVLHDLHPDDLEARVLGALDRVRPYLGSHAGGVELLGIDEHGVVRLRLEGSCDGCPSSLVTVRLAIEAAIDEAAPEIAGVVVDGVTDDRPAVGDQPAPVAFLPTRPRAQSETTPVPWITLRQPPPAAGLHGTEIDGYPVLFAALGEARYAYRDVCPACGEPLHSGELDGRILECGTCAERYDLYLAGRPVVTGALALDPLPLLPDADRWRIALPVVVR